MEFMKYHAPVSKTEREDRTMPRIGTLIVTKDFEGSDCNLYPDCEVFGICKKGRYPLYAKVSADYDSESRWFIHVRIDTVFASVPGTSYDGKIGFRYPFRIYDYEIKEYVGEGTPLFRIELDPPFYVDQQKKYECIQGFDPLWLDPLNQTHLNYATVDEAKKALGIETGKHGVAVTNVAGERTILVGSDCVYDELWDKLRERLLGFVPAAKPNEDLAVEEASRLRDEFIKSLERVCGAKVDTIFDEF